MQDIETKDRLLERQRTELLKPKRPAFLKPKLRGFVQFDCKPVKLLNQGGVWTPDKLCSTLHINIQDQKALKIFTRQLEELKKFKLIEETARGWKWKK